MPRRQFVVGKALLTRGGTARTTNDEERVSRRAAGRRTPRACRRLVTERKVARTRHERRLAQIATRFTDRLGFGQLDGRRRARGPLISRPPDAAKQSRLHRYVPIVGWLPAYKRAYCSADALAGLSVWALFVPQGLAYATLAGVPVQYGLYTAFAALLAYPLFGPPGSCRGSERHRLAVSRRVVAPWSAPVPWARQQAAPYAAGLAVATAIVYVALGLLRMGWVSTFLSKAVMAGFVLGFSIGSSSTSRASCSGATGHTAPTWRSSGDVKKLSETNATTLVVGAGSLVLLLPMRYLLPKLPRALIVMVLAIVASTVFDLSSTASRSRATSRPGCSRSGSRTSVRRQSGALVAGSLAIVFVGYSESLAAARAMAQQARL